MLELRLERSARSLARHASSRMSGELRAQARGAHKVSQGRDDATAACSGGLALACREGGHHPSQGTRPVEALFMLVVTRAKVMP